MEARIIRRGIRNIQTLSCGELVLVKVRIFGRNPSFALQKRRLIEPHWVVENNDGIYNIWRISGKQKSTLDLKKTMAYLKPVLVVKTRQSPKSCKVTPIPHRIFSVICE